MIKLIIGDCMTKKKGVSKDEPSFIELAKSNFKKMDKLLLLTTIILIIVGTLSIVSASSRETVVRYNYSMYYFFNKHLKILLFSLVACIIAILIPTKYYKILGPVAFLGITGLILSLFIIGSIKRGSQGWFSKGGQPSELAKPIIIVMIALLFDYYNNYIKKKKPFNWINYLIYFLLFGAVLPVITLMQGDMGTALLTVGISGIMLLAGPVSKQTTKKCIISIILLGIFGCFMLEMSRGYIFSSEQIERLTEFINPCKKYEDSGYQICNGFIAMNDGGLTGLGIGKSRQKYSYIPDPHTDSIFAVIIEEAGLITGTFILLIYLLMIARILNISSRTKNVRNRYISFGIAAYLFLHIVFNLGGLLGILPLTGVPLPLITYGGSFTLSFLLSLTIVQRICIESKN